MVYLLEFLEPLWRGLFVVNFQNINLLLWQRFAVASLEAVAMDSCGLTGVDRTQEVSDPASNRLAHDDVRAFPVFLELWRAVSDGIVHQDKLSDGKLLCCRAPVVIVFLDNLNMSKVSSSLIVNG